MRSRMPAQDPAQPFLGSGTAARSRPGGTSGSGTRPSRRGHRADRSERPVRVAVRCPARSTTGSRDGTGPRAAVAAASRTGLSSRPHGRVGSHLRQTRTVSPRPARTSTDARNDPRTMAMRPCVRSADPPQDRSRVHDRDHPTLVQVEKPLVAKKASVGWIVTYTVPPEPRPFVMMSASSPRAPRSRSQ